MVGVAARIALAGALATMKQGSAISFEEDPEQQEAKLQYFEDALMRALLRWKDPRNPRSSDSAT